MFTSLEVKGDYVVSCTAVSTNEAFCFIDISLGALSGSQDFSRRCNKLRPMGVSSEGVSSRIRSHYNPRRVATRRRATREAHEANSAETGCVGSGFDGCNYRARLGCISFRIGETFSFTTSRRGRCGPFPEFRYNRGILRLEEF